MTMTRQGLIHVLQALQHADDMMYHDIHEHGAEGYYNEDDRALAAMIDNTIEKAAHMLDHLYPLKTDTVTARIDDALADQQMERREYSPPPSSC